MLNTFQAIGKVAIRDGGGNSNESISENVSHKNGVLQ
jgi:hypothetical protein